MLNRVVFERMPAHTVSSGATFSRAARTNWRTNFAAPFSADRHRSTGREMKPNERTDGRTNEQARRQKIGEKESNLTNFRSQDTRCASLCIRPGSSARVWSSATSERVVHFRLQPASVPAPESRIKRALVVGGGDSNQLSRSFYRIGWR
jgi:hypothetical protein